MSRPIPAPWSLRHHEPERCQPHPSEIVLPGDPEPGDRFVSRSERVSDLQAQLAEEIRQGNYLRGQLAAARSLMDEREERERQRTKLALNHGERLAGILRRLIEEQDKGEEPFETCDECEGTGLDVDHARRLYTDEWGDPVGGTEFMSVAEIAALYRDDYGDEPAACTAEGCFEGRFIA